MLLVYWEKIHLEAPGADDCLGEAWRREVLDAGFPIDKRNLGIPKNTGLIPIGLVYKEKYRPADRPLCDYDL